MYPSTNKPLFLYSLILLRRTNICIAVRHSFSDGGPFLSNKLRSSTYLPSFLLSTFPLYSLYLILRPSFRPPLLRPRPRSKSGRDLIGVKKSFLKSFLIPTNSPLITKSSAPHLPFSTPGERWRGSMTEWGSRARAFCQNLRMVMQEDKRKTSGPAPTPSIIRQT